MYAVVKEVFYTSSGSWYESGYSTRSYTIFPTEEKAQEFINSLKVLPLYNKSDECFYVVDTDKVKHYLDMKNDTTFFETADFEDKTYEVVYREDQLFRYYIKPVEFETEIYVSHEERGEPGYLTFMVPFECNDLLSSKQYIFRKGKEARDLYEHWYKANYKVNFTLPINLEEKQVEVHCLEVAFWIQKEYLQNKDKFDFVLDFIEQDGFTRKMWNSIKFNTLLHCTLDEAIKLYIPHRAAKLFDIKKNK
jgi:hypothetical protein